jgi:hypothetical protein
MTTSARFNAAATLLLLVILANSCSAQGLFGERSVGTGSRLSPPRSNTRETSARSLGSQDAASGIQRRFLRSERGAGNFVGGSSAADGGTEFIGRQSAAQTAVDSAIGLSETRPPVNRPRVTRPTGLYPERLSLAPAAQSTARPLSQPTVSRSVSDFLTAAGMSIEVLPEERKAIVRGAVPSDEDRRMIELLVLLEPGIHSVQNLLTIDPAAPDPKQQKRAPASAP